MTEARSQTGRPGPLQRAAVSSVFLANGLAAGSWSVLVPVVMRNAGLTESGMGTVILTGGAASVFALFASGTLVARFGANPVMVIAGIVLAPSLFLIQTATGQAGAMLAFMLLLGAMAFQDVAMNANGAELEASMPRPIMSSLHAFWSLGAMLGAGAGGLMIAHFGAALQTMIAGGLVLALTGLAWPHLHRSTIARVSGLSLRGGLARSPVVYLFGMMAFAGFISEGAVIDWSAAYLRRELEASVEFSGFAFAGFSASMMIGRFAGDALRYRFGMRRLMDLSVLASASGLALASAADTAPLAVAGFVLAGFGNANIVPLAFSSAAAVRGISPGIGIATATICGYTGILFAPALLGYVAELAGYAMVYFLMATLVGLLIVLRPLLPAERGGQAVQPTLP